MKTPSDLKFRFNVHALSANCKTKSIMSKQISIKTSAGTKLYKISQSGNNFYCMKYNDSFFGSWTDIGSARNFEDALTIIKSYATSRYGSIYTVKIL
jgi:hypothetical protein